MARGPAWLPRPAARWPGWPGAARSPANRADDQPVRRPLNCVLVLGSHGSPLCRASGRDAVCGLPAGVAAC